MPPTRCARIRTQPTPRCCCCATTDRLEPEAARVGLRVAAATCGPSRALLAAQAQNAHALARRQRRARRARRAGSTLLPNDAQAHRARLRCRAGKRRRSGCCAAAEAALYAVPSAEVIERCARGADGARSSCAAFEAAAELALRVARRAGQARPELCAARARRGAQRAARTALLRPRARAAHRDRAAPARAPALCSSSRDHHREHGDAAAEVRALLRVLELTSPDHAPHSSGCARCSLRRATATRLLAVVALLLERERDPARRARAAPAARARSPASCSATASAPSSRCARWSPRARDEPARVREALGVLFTLGGCGWALDALPGDRRELPAGARQPHLPVVRGDRRPSALQDDAARARDRAARRAALARPTPSCCWWSSGSRCRPRTRSTAMEVYDALIAAAVGPHGRRALLYRAGALARARRSAGAGARALPARRSSSRRPTGAAFKAIERLARQTGQPSCVAALLRASSPDRRATGARAARCCARPASCACASSSDRAARFALLLQANASDRALRARRSAARAGARLVRERRRGGPAPRCASSPPISSSARRELWNAEDKVRCLLRLARLRSERPARARERARATRRGARAGRERGASGESAAALARAGRVHARVPRREPPAEARRMRDATGSGRCSSTPERRGTDRSDDAVPRTARVLAPCSRTSPQPSRRAAPRPSRADSVPPARRLRVPAETPAHSARAPAPPARRRAVAHRCRCASSHATRRSRTAGAASATARASCSRSSTAASTPAPDAAFHSGLWRGRALRDAIGERPAPELSPASSAALGVRARDPAPAPHARRLRRERARPHQPHHGRARSPRRTRRPRACSARPTCRSTCSLAGPLAGARAAHASARRARRPRRRRRTAPALLYAHGARAVAGAARAHDRRRAAAARGRVELIDAARLAFAPALAPPAAPSRRHQGARRGAVAERADARAARSWPTCCGAHTTSSTTPRCARASAPAPRARRCSPPAASLRATLPARASSRSSRAST